MYINHKHVTGINNHYIHINENGNQSSVKTKLEDVKQLRESFINELPMIEYAIKQLENELESYDPKIETVIKIIDTLSQTIKDGIKVENPKFVRQLANEYFDLEWNKSKLESLYQNMNGINAMLCKLIDLKSSYKTRAIECNIIINKH